jgi:hypothetical protein
MKMLVIVLAHKPHKPHSPRELTVLLVVPLVKLVLEAPLINVYHAIFNSIFQVLTHVYSANQTVQPAILELLV